MLQNSTTSSKSDNVYVTFANALHFDAREQIFFEGKSQLSPNNVCMQVLPFKRKHTYAVNGLIPCISNNDILEWFKRETKKSRKNYWKS